MENSVIEQTTEIAVSAAGALVGYAIGGPEGAVIGSITVPASKLASEIMRDWVKRRISRVTWIVDRAFQLSSKKEIDILNEMQNNPEWADKIIDMIQKLADSDPKLANLFSMILSSAIDAHGEGERNRLVILYESINGLNFVQIQIIMKLYEAGMVLSAKDISFYVGIPELELRNAVRNLELRGIIEDNGSEPTIWHLRELGKAIAEYIKKMEGRDEQGVF